MKVVLSEHSLTMVERFEQVFNVSKIYVHNYNYKTFNNDIMVIKVSSLQCTAGTNDTWHVWSRMNYQMNEAGCEAVSFIVRFSDS